MNCIPFQPKHVHPVCLYMSSFHSSRRSFSKTFEKHVPGTRSASKGPNSKFCTTRVIARSMLWSVESMIYQFLCLCECEWKGYFCDYKKSECVLLLVSETLKSKIEIVCEEKPRSFSRTTNNTTTTNKKEKIQSFNKWSSFTHLPHLLSLSLSLSTAAAAAKCMRLFIVFTHIIISNVSPPPHTKLKYYVSASKKEEGLEWDDIDISTEKVERDESSSLWFDVVLEHLESWCWCGRSRRSTLGPIRRRRFVRIFFKDKF